MLCPSFLVASECIPLVVNTLMNGVADKWTSIGLFLGIPYKSIEVFKMEDRLEDSITKMVDAWVKRQHDTGIWRAILEETC